MKINEIIIENSLDEWSDTDPHIEDELAAKGYTYLNKGVDQSAYLEPKNSSESGKVLKIFGTQKNTLGSKGKKLSKDQKMFIIWANFCDKNTNNKFLPKFYGYERFVYNDHTYIQMRQEKLSSCSPTFGNSLALLAEAVDVGLSTVPAILKYLHCAVRAFLENKLGKADLITLTKTLIALRNIANEKKGWIFDLHADNFMMRGKTPVILDPWVIKDTRVWS